MRPRDVLENILQDFRGFFSKPQFDNFKNYMNGIVNIECRRTINHINEGTGIKKDQSQLNRFITKPKWDVFDMQEYYDRYVVQKVVDRSGKYIFLVLDDTIKEVSGDNKIEAVNKYFDHTQKRFLYGHKIFTSCITNGFGFTVPFEYEIFRRKSECKAKKIPYKKITKMAEDRIEKFERLNTKGKEKIVLFDVYYAAKKILKRTLELSMHFVTKAKRNKKFIVAGKEMKAKQLDSILPFSGEVKIKGVIYQYSEPIKVEWYGLGYVYIMKSKPKDSKEVQYYITDLKISGSAILKTYSNRWEIEVMHRDIKQNFGFADYRVRKLDAIKVHMLLSSIAYSMISIIRFDILSKYLKKIKHKVFDKIKKYFTLGKICKFIRTEQWAEVFILPGGVKFMLSKNAKL